MGSQTLLHWFRFVPMAMVQSAIGGFVLLIVAAMGTWAVYGEIRRPPVHDSRPMCAQFMPHGSMTEVPRKHDHEQ